MLKGLAKKLEGERDAQIKSIEERFALMKSLCDELQDKIGSAQLDGEYLPTTEVAEGERVVGVLPEPLRQLYVVYSTMLDELEEECGIVHESIFESLSDLPMRDKMDQNKLIDKIVEMHPEHLARHERMDMVSDMFWGLVQDSFPELKDSKEGMGVRKDWQVVLKPAKKRKSPIAVGPIILIPRSLLKNLSE